MHPFILRRFLRAMVLGNWPTTRRVEVDMGEECPELTCYDEHGAKLGVIEMWLGGTSTADANEALRELLAAHAIDLRKVVVETSEKLV